jgi:hypothetical protein
MQAVWIVHMKLEHRTRSRLTIWRCDLAICSASNIIGAQIVNSLFFFRFRAMDVIMAFAVTAFHPRSHKPKLPIMSIQAKVFLRGNL